MKEQSPEPRKLGRLGFGIRLESLPEAQNHFLQGCPAATAALTNSSGARGTPQAVSIVAAESATEEIPEAILKQILADSFYPKP